MGRRMELTETLLGRFCVSARDRRRAAACRGRERSPDGTSCLDAPTMKLSPSNQTASSGAKLNCVVALTKYSVVAFDAAGNTSAPSNAATVTVAGRQEIVASHSNRAGPSPKRTTPLPVTSYCDIVTVVASVHRLSCGEFSTGPPVPTLLPL